MKKILFLFTLLCTLGIVLVSCGGGNNQPVQYRITFDSNGGTRVAAIVGEKDMEISAPTNPTKNGFEFIGWYLEDTLYVFDKMPSSNITLVAKWKEIVVEPTKYTITFDEQGGSTVADITDEAGKSITLPTPAKEGYEFLGWYLNEVKYEETVMGNKNITLVAKWKEIVVEPTKYTITFDEQGGSTVDDITEEAGKSITLPTPTKEGYEFLGWYLNNVEYKETVMGNQNITLVAKWKEIKYTITFDEQGGSSVADITEEAGKSITLPTSTKEGYEFLGWYLNEVKYEETVMGNQNITLVAKWKEIKYTITFDEQGGSSVADITKAPGSSITLPTPTKEGYEFLGWYLNEVKYEETVMGNQNITLVAKWKEKQVSEEITVTYMLNGGNTKYVTYADMVADFATDFTAFSGRTVLADGTNFFNITYKDDGTSLGYNFLTSATYSSKWSWMLNLINETRVLCGKTALKSGDGQAEARGEIHCLLNRISGSDGQTVGYGSDYSGYTNYSRIEAAISGDKIVIKTIAGSMLIENVYKNGYTFEGWYSDASLTTKVSTVTAETLYAKWVKIEKTLTYVINNDNATLSNNTIKFHISDSFELETPIFDSKYYVFNGWFLDEDFTKNITSISEFTSQDVTVYGSWTKLSDNQYQVEFKLDGGIWDYETREQIVDDFLNDAMEWGNETEKPNCMVDDSGEKSGFANVFSTLSGFFDDEKYATKWSWLKDYVIATSPDKTQFTGSYKESFYRYSVGAFLFQDYRSSWPKSADYTQSELANGFWDELANAQQTTFIVDSSSELNVPFKRYFIFKGWYNNANFTGEPVTQVTSNCTLYAKWEEEVPASSVVINNKVDEIKRFATYQLEWVVNPSNVGNKEVEFISSDETVATIDNKGLITAHNNGTVTITIKSLSSSGASDSLSFNVYEPGYFEASYQTNSYVEINETIKLNANYVNTDGSAATLTWKSLNTNIATVNEGAVTGVNAGVATIRVSKNETEYFDFVVTVLPSNISAALMHAVNSHESNVFTKYNLGIGSGTPKYYADIIGSVSKMLANKKLEINDKYVQTMKDKYGSTLESRRMESIEFITVHYTGNMNNGSDAEANMSYFSDEKYSTSIHYTTGNDGVYSGLEEPYRAAHAGDDGAVSFGVPKFEWRPTTIKIEATDPLFPVVTITTNATFAINGEDTGIKVPYESKKGRGYVNDNKWLNDMGIAVDTTGEYYQLGTAWWCYTQVSEGRICSNGGNKNSIGIESCVDQGSDLWYTWQLTAQLVADIMVRNNLDITRVKGHHFFSAKDCPQPMLENDLEIWGEFIELVQAEYELLTTFKDAQYSFVFDETCEIVNQNGRIVEQPEYTSVVQYTVNVTVNGQTESITLASIVEGIYCR